MITDKAGKQDVRALEKKVREDYMSARALEEIEDESNLKIRKLNEK